MNNKEVLEKASKKKAHVGEMESAKINKACWIAVIVAGILAVAFMIIEGALGHFSAIFAIGGVCYAWASIFYFCQYFVAKRKFVGILIGGVLHGLACITMITLYILFNVGVL